MLYKKNREILLKKTCAGMSTLTHFWPMVPFYTPWKHQENTRFSNAFRGYKMGILARNVLMKFQSYSCHTPLLTDFFQFSILHCDSLWLRFKLIRHHSFSPQAKFSEKLTFLYLWNAHLQSISKLIFKEIPVDVYFFRTIKNRRVATRLRYFPICYRNYPHVLLSDISVQDKKHILKVQL